jgi:6-phosphogluconolactonase
MTQQQIIYVSGYTDAKHPDGIHLFEFDTATGTLTHREDVGGAENPSFVAISPDRSCLLAVSEVGEYNGIPGGAVVSYAIDSENGALTPLNSQSTHGEHPCYVSFDGTGRWAFFGNYSGGSLGMMSVRESGSLGETTVVIRHHGHGPNEKRQDKAHVHCVRVDPLNRHLFVTDLGLDQIIAYPLDLTEGRIDSSDAHVLHAAAGAGPRHIAFHPNERVLYISNELDSTVAVYALEAMHGMTALQTVSTLPDGFKQHNDAADIHLSRDGRYLYVSNRGHNSIAGFAIDPETGLLSSIGHTSVEGNWPRNFGFDATGDYLLVANQRSNNVVVFRYDAETGRLKATGHQVKVPSPVCVQAMALS